mmetsp:Transcript_3233/g.9195  ORF Transcript_3233/g.9195 Transcript_3233/m.9195 type:complete len:310 (+) Transcript_3233:1175-2104(+)
MKGGAEVHFLAGQVFTLGVATLAVAPRMPFDDARTVGGKLSFPFRRALLALVAIGMFRVVVCHILFPGLSSLDAILGTTHVIGQSFLCLTTAYLLQLQLSQVINITPGSSLTTVLVSVAMLTLMGEIGSSTVHPNLSSLVHLAQALSSYGVLETLRTYANVMAPNSSGRGPFLTQLLRLTEYCFMATSVLAFLGEASDGFILTKFHHDGGVAGVDVEQDHPIVVLLKALEYNQDSGVDDWTRLLIHSIFLNSLDEMQHFTNSGSSSGAASQEHQTNTDTSKNSANQMVPLTSTQPSAAARARHGQQVRV